MRMFNLYDTMPALYIIMFCFQEEFVGLVYKETILVGHSLENDLLALRISHDLIIDTAVLYKHNRGSRCKIALRVLAKKFLSLEIQNTGTGHDSVEDARAALELAILKIKYGKIHFFNYCFVWFSNCHFCELLTWGMETTWHKHIFFVLCAIPFLFLWQCVASDDYFVRS